MSSLFFCLASSLRRESKVQRGGAYDEIYGKLVRDRKSIRKIIVDFS